MRAVQTTHAGDGAAGAERGNRARTQEEEVPSASWEPARERPSIHGNLLGPTRLAREPPGRLHFRGPQSPQPGGKLTPARRTIIVVSGAALSDRPPPHHYTAISRCSSVLARIRVTSADDPHHADAGPSSGVHPNVHGKGRQHHGWDATPLGSEMRKE